MAERSRWSPAAIAEWGLVAGLAKLLSRLPESWAYAVGEGAGRLACRLDRRHRAVVTENLAAAFPGRYAPAELDRVAAEVFANLGRTAVDVARSDRLASRPDDADVAVEGLEHLLAALSAGLPDCAGVAMGVDRLLMAMLGTHRIADVLAFDFGRG